MEKSVKNLVNLSDNDLSLVQGGGKNGANLFLSGFAGAVEGVVLCAQSVPFMTPQGYLVCGAAGAVAGVIWPR